jgi:general secretion pathway protein L
MNAVINFFKWWIEELARVIEPLTMRRGAAPAYVLVQDGGRFICLRSGRKGMKEIGVVEAGAAADSDVLKKLKNQAVELRLDEDAVLDKELTLPSAGQQYLDAILRHQIERLTPWAADRVAFDYVTAAGAPAGEGQVAIRLVATSRDTVAAALEPLAAAGIKPRSVGTAADPLDHQSPVDLQDDGKIERQSSLRRAVAVGMAAAAAIIVIIGGVQTWEVFRLSGESAQVQAAVEARRKVIAEAVARTTSSDEYRALAARKSSAVPMVVLLEELSKTIPVNTYVTELNVEGSTVRINGMSSEVPALIELLEDAETLEAAEFGAPTTRNEKGGRDSFQIVVRVEDPEAEEE